MYSLCEFVSIYNLQVDSLSSLVPIRQFLTVQQNCRHNVLVTTMADSSKASTPFDWLSSGIFFGKAKGGLERIDSSKDVPGLLTGVRDNLDAILALGEVPIEVEESDDTNEATNPSKFLAARLSRLRFLLYDERRMTSQQELRRGSPAVAGATLQVIICDPLADLMPRLLESITFLPFESRKHVAAVFNYLLVCGLDGNDASIYKQTMDAFRDYVEVRFIRFMTLIVQGHEAPAGDIALHFGSMYRSCARHPSLYRQLVGTTERTKVFVFPFLDTYVHLPNFDVSSDAMESLKVVFSAASDRVHEEQAQQDMAQIAADFLNRDYEDIWDERFNPKLLSDSANYMTRRVALQILSGVLLTRSNYAVMIRYVSSRTNLILVMHLLRDTSPHITLDAFHVFKVFVANPNKPEEVVKILRDNKTKLCRYLATLHQEKEESDTQFRDEKALIIATIEVL